MQQSFVSVMLAGLVASAGTYAVSSAEPQQDRAEALCHQSHSSTGCDSDIEILVNGTPQTRYAHDGRWYVEALKGREYTIRIRNPYPVRAAVALSVDGLNTIDARHTAASDARKWVLDLYQTITISGWQVSSTHARTFEFTTEDKSYGAALHKTANLGMISAVYFRERSSSIVDRPSSVDAAPSVERRPSSNDADARMEPQSSSSLGESVGSTARSRSRAADEYAATGMGQRTGHAVTRVHLDLEPTPAQTVNIRYEFRPQLVRLGILPEARDTDPLRRRERARGFEAGFAPEVR